MTTRAAGERTRSSVTAAAVGEGPAQQMTTRAAGERTRSSVTAAAVGEGPAQQMTTARSASARAANSWRSR
jgi:hypothetical protein